MEAVDAPDGVRALVVEGVAAVLAPGDDGGGEERLEGGGDADGAPAGAAPAVGDGEGLVQIDVQQVDAEVAGAHLADHGVHVGAVAVDVAAHLVGQAADLGDLALEEAEGVGHGDHDRGAVVVQLGLEVLEVELAGACRSCSTVTAL